MKCRRMGEEEAAISRVVLVSAAVLLSGAMGALSSAAAPAAAAKEGRTLEVGPGKPFANPSRALAAARDGDVIAIDARGDYTNDVALIDKNNLTIRGVGEGRAMVKTDGRVFGRKGIWVFADGARDLTIENIDLEGARVSDADGGNGAGLRAQGTNLTVRNCRFFNNQDGILGGFGVTTIEHCEFAHNGLSGLTHNLYIGDQKGTLLFRFNWTHDTAVGHLLKSRAAVSQILYNRITDESGAGSYEIDLPNGGRADVVGNVIEQSAASQNGVILAYGEEGVVDPKSALNVVNNTFVNDRHNGVFVNADRLPDGFRLVAKNNLFAGPGAAIAMNKGTPALAGNIMTTIAGAQFVDAAHFDYRLRPGSPAIGSGVAAGANGDGASLAPEFEYVHPMKTRKRPAATKLDAGAIQFKPF